MTMRNPNVVGITGYFPSGLCPEVGTPPLSDQRVRSFLDLEKIITGVRFRGAFPWASR